MISYSSSDSEATGAPFRNICLKNALEVAYVTSKLSLQCGKTVIGSIIQLHRNSGKADFKGHSLASHVYTFIKEDILICS